MRVNGNYIVFESGVRLYSHAGIVGVTVEGPLNVTEGYDGGLAEGSDAPISPEDWAELCAHMILRWAHALKAGPI